jgi:hypothetical protein
MWWEPARALSFWARGEEIPAGWAEEQVVKKYVDERVRMRSFEPSVRTSPVQQGQLKGVQIDMTYSGVLLRTRVFVINNRAYTIEAMSNGDSVAVATMERYFNSFVVLQ